MDNFKGSTLGRRSLRIANGISSNLPMKPLGVSNSQSSYERKTDLYSLRKSPINARKTLFESNAKENSDYALCKEFSSNRESTGTSPVVVNTKNTNDSQDKKKMKPRRSMLGLRSKTNLSNFTKDDTTVAKLLLSSSPINERLDSYNLGDVNLKPLYRKSISTPQLTPFDSDDIDTSAFFNKGISDSTWSVFKKVEQKTTYEAPVTRGSLMSGKARQLRQSLASSLDQEVKLKWLSKTFQKEGNNPVEINKIKDKSADEYSRGSGESTDHEDDNYSQNKSDNNFTQSSKECISPIETINYNNIEELDESSTSMDSYIQNETIILNRGKNNLEMIEEEGVNRDSLCGESYNNVNDTDYEVTAITDSNSILTLFEDLKIEKEAMDSKWFAFMKQREVFENKWNDFASMMKMFEENSRKEENSNTTIKNSSKPKKVICTKLRKSIASSPRVCKKLFKSSNISSSKTCSEGKTNMSSCKTPISTDKRLKMLRKSLCYTPNTLSRKVDDQAKDIFGEI